jgi:hypothetical protein
MLIEVRDGATFIKGQRAMALSELRRAGVTRRAIGIEAHRRHR